MENFEFYNPCRILFGDGKLDRLGELIRAYSDNILLVYGKSSIRKMGLYDEIVTILNRDGIRFTEISGVEANPKMDLVYQGIAIGSRAALFWQWAAEASLIPQRQLPWAFLTPEMCGMCFSVMRRRPGLYPSEPF